MDPESLTQLIGSGNTAAVEDAWMKLVESPDATVDALIKYRSVLESLGERQRVDVAETLAWTAVEAISERTSKKDAIRLAGKYLRALPKDTSLRNNLVELYREVYADRDGLDELLEEAGLAGGRPVRRAVRTLDVALSLKEGDWLAERHEEGAARVESIDVPAWEFTITTPDGEDTLEAVYLADRFMRAEANDFRVMRQFNPDGLQQLLNDDPLPVLISLCNMHHGKMTSDQLHDVLVPEVLTAKEWRSWWTKARAAAKKCRNLELSGRNPYELEYVEPTHSHEETLRKDFDRPFDPHERLAIIERYLSDCKQYDHEPSKEALAKCRAYFPKRAAEVEHHGPVDVFAHLVIARQVGEWAGQEDPGAELREFLADRDDYIPLLTSLGNDSLLGQAMKTLVEARPDGYKELLIQLLPYLPQGLCDDAVAYLEQAAATSADLEPSIQQILTEAVEHFDALLWIWDGPKNAALVASPPPMNVLQRMLWAMEELKRNDQIPRQKAKHIAQRARAVLAARKYQQFNELLDTLDAGVANTLRTQIRRLDNLGRAVHEDLQRQIERRFPPAVKPRFVPLWEQEDILYVTDAGMQKKHAEMSELVNVKMKENAKAIGEAASLGDLSENSEYKFALEERDLLRSRLAQMNAEMDIAQVLTEEQVLTEIAGIGSRIVFKKIEDGSTYELIILGPWDADLARHIYNYKAPLAQRIMGKAVGDVIEFEHGEIVGTYEIVSLHNALRELRTEIREEAASAAAGSPGDQGGGESAG